jgi:hypothetical protein
MKRFGLGLVMWALLLLLLPFSVGGCNISCACSVTPDPRWTTTPIGTGEAAMSGAKFAGVPSMTAERSSGPRAGPSTERPHQTRLPWSTATRG